MLAMMVSVSRVRDTGDTASAEAAAAWAYLLIVLVFARAVIGGGLILIGTVISATPQSLVAPARPQQFMAVPRRWSNESWF